MKDCKKIHPLLPLYIEGQLSSTEKNQVDKHLGVCQTARLELEHFRRLLEGMRNLPEPQVPADLHGKIMARLGQNPQFLTPRHHFWGPQIWGLAAAVVIVFVLFNQYPNWKDTWKVNQPEAPPVSTNTFTTTANAPAPASRETGFAKVMPEKANDIVALKKKQSGGRSVKANAPFYGAVAEKKSVDSGKDLSLTNSEVEKALTSTARPKADAFSEAEEAPALQRSAQKASRKAETNIAAGAAAPAPMAALPPASAVPSLDQSMRSLTYSQEQTVITWNGNNGPSTVESQELVTDPETFQKYWQIPHPGEAPPVVDFTKEAVVVLNAGEKPSAGYSIHLTRLEEKANQLVIHYKVDSPAPDAVAAAMITHPWVLQIIPKPSKPVAFLKDP